MGKRRLDTLLAERGLFSSRTRAAASVMAGEVRVGPGERRAQKPGEMIDPEEIITVSQPRAYVSRGGIKLANALDASGLDVTGRLALDVGASTGGFTDCLLQRGAEHVVAIDVGYGLLDYRLRTDPRVSVLERTNARSLTPELLAQAGAAQAQAQARAAQAGAAQAEAGMAQAGLARIADLAVVDVSFISLSKVLGPVIGCLDERHDILAMVKPQFEVGRERVGKGGVVRDAGDRREALIAVGGAAVELGESVLGCFSSGLPGPKGNRETFLWLAEGQRRPGAPDLAAMAAEVEP